MRLDLISDANDKFGELTISVASALTSTTEAVESANRDAQELGPGLAKVNDVIQAATPLATAIIDQSNAWQPLLSRLGVLMKVADAVAEARSILNHLCPTITKKFTNRFTPGSSWHGELSQPRIR
jgi:hypothetical protein